MTSFYAQIKLNILFYLCLAYLQRTYTIDHAILIDLEGHDYWTGLSSLPLLLIGFHHTYLTTFKVYISSLCDISGSSLDHLCFHDVLPVDCLLNSFNSLSDHCYTDDSFNKPDNLKSLSNLGELDVFKFPQFQLNSF